eukprot:3773300-Prymnesium_polylepis.1
MSRHLRKGQTAKCHKPCATADDGADEIAEDDAAVQDEARRIACLVEDPQCARQRRVLATRPLDEPRTRPACRPRLHNSTTGRRLQQPGDARQRDRRRRLPPRSAILPRGDGDRGADHVGQVAAAQQPARGAAHVVATLGVEDLQVGDERRLRREGVPRQVCL